MARQKVWIDGKDYRVLSWNAGQRPSQEADPSVLVVAEWKVDGPMGFTYEDITQGFGVLAVDFPDGVDTRFPNTACLGPLINAVTLSTHDISWTSALFDDDDLFDDASALDASVATDNVNGLATVKSAGTSYAYAIRGGTSAKVDLSDMSLEAGGAHAFPEAPTSIVSTVTKSNKREVSVGMPTQAYQVITNIDTPPSPDTWVQNDQGVVARILAQAPDRVVGMGADQDGTGNVVAGNLLVGSISMAEPAWTDITTDTAPFPSDVTFTGFGLDGAFYVIMTDDGPFMLDADLREFFNLIPEIPRSLENRVVGSWFPLGTTLGLSSGARYQRFGSGASYGLEKFRLNRSVVQGFPTATAASMRWLYEAWYNPVENDTWIIAWRERQPGDGHAFSDLSPFPIAKFNNLRCNAMLNVDDVGGLRTNPTLIGGRGSNLFYMTLGRTVQEIDDANYQFTTGGGTLYLTEMRRYPGMIKQPQAAEFKTRDCTSNTPVQLQMSVDGAAAVNVATVTTNGWQRVLFASAGVPLTTTTGKDIKPQFVLSTSGATLSPKIEGPLRLHFKVRPILTEYVDAVLELHDNGIDGGSEAQQDNLFAVDEGGTVLVGEDQDMDRWYADIEKVAVRKSRAGDYGGGTDSSKGQNRVAEVRLVRWPVANGD